MTDLPHTPAFFPTRFVYDCIYQQYNAVGQMCCPLVVIDVNFVSVVTHPSCTVQCAANQTYTVFPKDSPFLLLLLLYEVLMHKDCLFGKE